MRMDDILSKYPDPLRRGGGRKDSFLLGNNAIDRRPIRITEEELKRHWHILGTTGKGKTKYIEHLARTLIERKNGLCLVDPHGDLYEAMVKYVVRNRLEKKVILIDPNRRDNLFGLNYMERGAHIAKDPDAHVSMIMRAIGKVFGGENQDALPRLQHWERNVLYALMDQGFTLVEMLDFLSLTNPEARRHIVEKLNDPYIKQDWQEFEALRRQEKEIRLESVLNRAVKFVGSERIRRIVGQAKSTINFRQAMDEGKIVLVNLSSRHISEEGQKMLGVMIVDMIVEAGFSRGALPERQRKPFYFIVDEFGEFVCEDFAKALNQLRKYGVFLMLSNQELEQLKEENRKVYAAVMSDCENKVVFGISREDAEVMAKELFTGMIRGDQIKNIIEQTKFWPKETTRRITSQSDSESSGSGDSFSSATSDIAMAGQASIFGPDGPAFFSDAVSQSISSSQTTGSSSSSGSSNFSGTAHSSSESEVPWYEYEPFKEISSQSYYSPEELLEKFISWIKNQGRRQAQLKIDVKRPMPIVTPTINEIVVRPIEVERFENNLALLYAKPIEQIDIEISRRRELLLAPPEKGEEEESVNFRE